MDGRGRRRGQAGVAIGALGALLGGALLVACSSAPGDDGRLPTTTRPPVPSSTVVVEGPIPVATAEEVVSDLGCDQVAKAKVSMPYLVQTLECTREGTYVGRIHAFEATASVDDVRRTVERALLARYPVPTENQVDSACQSPGVVAGDRWAVLTPTEEDAPAVAEATGGTILPPIDHGAVISYPVPPCPADGPS